MSLPVGPPNMAITLITPQRKKVLPCPAGESAMITLTEKAAAKVKEIREAESLGEQGLRLRVIGGGCSGFQWKLELEPEPPTDKDGVYEQDGITIIVDRRSALYVEGTTIDHSDDLNHRGFICTNERVRSKCGCGSSFSM